MMPPQQTLPHQESSLVTFVFQKYQPLILATISRYHLPSYEREDLLQEALLVCHKTLKHYESNENQPKTYGAYLKSSLNNHFCSLFRKEAALKRQINFKTSSLEQLYEEKGDTIFKATQGTFNSPEDYLFNNHAIFEAYDKFSKLEKLVFFEILIHQVTALEIATKLELSYGTVQSAVFRCKHKLKKQLK